MKICSDHKQQAFGKDTSQIDYMSCFKCTILRYLHAMYKIQYIHLFTLHTVLWVQGVMRCNRLRTPPGAEWNGGRANGGQAGKAEGGDGCPRRNELECRSHAYRPDRRWESSAKAGTARAIRTGTESRQPVPKDERERRFFREMRTLGKNPASPGWTPHHRGKKSCKNAAVRDQPRLCRRPAEPPQCVVTSKPSKRCQPWGVRPQAVTEMVPCSTSTTSKP